MTITASTAHLIDLLPHISIEKVFCEFHVGKGYSARKDANMEERHSHQHIFSVLVYFLQFGHQSSSTFSNDEGQ